MLARLESPCLTRLSGASRLVDDKMTSQRKDYFYLTSVVTHRCKKLMINFVRQVSRKVVPTSRVQSNVFVQFIPTAAYVVVTADFRCTPCETFRPVPFTFLSTMSSITDWLPKVTRTVAECLPVWWPGAGRGCYLGCLFCPSTSSKVRYRRTTVGSVTVV